ncbi:MAG TPA: hypothetical protein VGS06_21160 [Streptosporangiaceae bacterium]|nr:hypothetical protein [Streptosporangiaceae bacterium]
MTNRTAAATSPATRIREPPAGAGATAEFERLYRANVDVVTAYFARRTADPQAVADLTADTLVAVITYFGSFDPRKGTAGLGVRDRPERLRLLLRGEQPAAAQTAATGRPPPLPRSSVAF